MSTKEKEAELRAMQEKYGVDGAPLSPHNAHSGSFLRSRIASVTLQSLPSMACWSWGRRLLCRDRLHGYMSPPTSSNPR